MYPIKKSDSRARLTLDNSKFEELYSCTPRNEPDYAVTFTNLSAEKCSNEENVYFRRSDWPGQPISRESDK